MAKVSGKTLSKKQRKRLENIIQSKEKKAKRKELLEKLCQVRESKNYLHKLISTASMQTKGLRKHNHEKALRPETERTKKQRVTKLQTASSEDSESDSYIVTDDETDSPVNNNDLPMDSEEKSANCENANEHEEENFKTVPTKTHETALPSEQLTAVSVSKKPAVYITVNRKDYIQEARLKLPILAEEQVIMEAINENPVVILCGETGSGKTTQVPQFLYEAGYASTKMIGVTEPRRVAAISMSKRVAEELNMTSNDVSYQIRFEGNVRESTKIKFMTDGVLLKELQKDFLLLKYSVIIIDEAHERSVYTDVLIGLLSRIVPCRHKKNNPLKLIIMSATLRVEDFTENKRLFKVTPPVIKIESRQYPVTIHFNKRTPGNEYISEAYRKVCKIHRTLPDGGILVFVTGRQEVTMLCNKLSRTFPINKNSSQKQDEEELVIIKKRKRSNKTKHPKLAHINLDDFSESPCEINSSFDYEGISDQEDDDYEDFPLLNMESTNCQPLYVLPLFSLLSSDRQSKVFQPPPKNSRLCIVATNVAETSLTIPNIKYVVDTGKVKTKLYDKLTGVSAFVVTWTSKAGANQRAGRAGRTGPGHCYRLYSSAVFNDELELFTKPEICRRPIDDLVLQMKDMNIDRVINFPFPSPPDSDALKAAEKRLCVLGALAEATNIQRFRNLKKLEWSSTITTLGHTMASFPLAPCYAKMLALANQQGLLPYVVCIVSALTVQELLLDVPLTTDNTENLSVSNNERKLWHERRLKWAGQGQSLLLGDIMVLLKAVGSAEHAGCTPAFCLKHGLRHKAVIEVRKLRTQLTNSINLAMPNVDLCVDPKMQPPDDLKIRLLRQIILSGVINHVARKIPDSKVYTQEDKKKYKRAYECIEVDDLVYIDLSSVLHQSQPELIIYQEIIETSKLYLRGVTAIELEWLPIFAPKLCTFSKPLEDPKPRYDPVKDKIVCHMTSTFGPKCWSVPAVELEYPNNDYKYRWFAVYLLEGTIFVKLKKFFPFLLLSPTIMVKSWARLEPKTESLLKSLMKKAVDSKTSLINVWKEEDDYLLSAYCEWLPESIHDKVKKLWPPNDKEVR